MLSRPAFPFLAIAFLMVLAGCRREEGFHAAYRLSDTAAYSVRYEVSLEAGADGFRGAREYASTAAARFSVSALPDTSSGRVKLSLSAVTLSFRAPDREEVESRYMVERLKRYKARIVLTPAGLALSLEEEPDLPPVDFSPLNFGRYFLYGLPAFPDTLIREGSEWRIEQPLLDKFHPGSRVVKRFRAAGIRQTPQGRILECRVDVEAWLDEELEPDGAGSDAGRARPALTGRGTARFNLDRGTPVAADLELQGRFRARVRDGGTVEGEKSDHAILLELRLDLRFDD